MPSANLYVDEATFKSTIQVPGATTYLDDDIDSALSAASRGVDMACGKRRLRRFYPDTSDVSRYYTAHETDIVEINDLNTITSIYLDQDGDGDWELEVDAADYQLLPLNAEADEEPWTHIHLVEDYSERFHSWTGSVKVTGKFGWETTPPGVAEAVSLIAARLLKRKREAPFGVVGFGMDQAAAITIARNDPDVVSLLKPFMRNRTAVMVSVE